ncbi:MULTISPECIES: hypothetical protein [unclassified Variovorax]|uniref:hypothetical protein n=1 Tax=unclassified Variovorax TaxID=663243 RepID=UPI0013E08657|nr:MULTISPECIES: hypothetical protein [unclassified Variovorax]
MQKKIWPPLFAGTHFACIGFNDVQEMRAMRKKMRPAIVLACMVGLASAAYAATATTDGGGAALDAALKTCAASVAKDSNGGPDQTAMSACMTRAGFAKPSQDGEHRPPPPAGAAPRK